MSTNIAPTDDHDELRALVREVQRLIGGVTVLDLLSATLNLDELDEEDDEGELHTLLATVERRLGAMTVLQLGALAGEFCKDCL